MAAILFDEPLTVIDPALKWELRSKLKALHRALDLTMIYVTHDQTEALTFADTVVVMHEGSVVQTGTPDELFDAPCPHLRGLLHRLARHERAAGRGAGPPGAGRAATRLALARSYAELPAGARIEVGIRPEFVSIAAPAPGLLSARLERIDDLGRVRFARVRVGDLEMAATVPKGVSLGGDEAALVFDPAQIHVYADGTRARGDGVMEKTVNQKAWLLVLPVFAVVAFSARHPADDRGQLFGPGHVRQQSVLLERRRLVPGAARPLDRAGRPLLRLAVAQPRLLRDRAGDRDPARHRGRAGDAARGLGRGVLPGDAGAAAAHPVERRRHDLADLRPRPTSACWASRSTGWASTTITSPIRVDAWITIIVMDVWHWTSLVALLCYAGLKSIPEAYYQAASIDGASRWAVFTAIQLPKMRRVLLIAVLLRFMD